MNKISKITLENFRTFLGRKEINFNNSEGKPSDFICIYGKNGMGKTSLFDGFEWFFTGTILLLENDLKSNVDKYTGNILKNRYASQEDKARIEIKYSNGENGYRTVREQRNSQNDYGKGNTTGMVKEVVDVKQILPHNKIDSFVNASKPTQMYDSWGNFWDPKSQQRNIFDAIYKTYRLFLKEEEELRKSLNQMDDKAAKLDIKSQIENYNTLVYKYNSECLSETDQISSIIYSENQTLDIQQILVAEEMVEPLQAKISSIQFQYNQLDFLEKHIAKYLEIKKIEEDKENQKNRREKIIQKCCEKRKLLDNQAEYYANYKNKKYEKIKLTEKFDSEWFENYQEFISAQTKYLQIIEEYKRIQENNKIISNNLQDLKTRQNLLKTKLKLVSNKYCYWEKNISKLLDDEKKIKKQIKDLAFLEKKDDINKQNSLYIDELDNLNKALLDYESFMNSLDARGFREFPCISVEYDDIQDLKKKINEKNNIKRKVDYQYRKMADNVDNLSELLSRAKADITKGKKHICPVCKSTFSSMNELISKLDLSTEQEILSGLQYECNQVSNDLNELHIKYNEEKDRIKQILCKRKEVLQYKIKNNNELLNEYKKTIENLENQLEEINTKRIEIQSDICKELEIESIELNETEVKSVYEKKVFSWNKMLDECISQINDFQTKLVGIETVLKNSEDRIEELKKQIETFKNSQDNQEKLKILTQRGINTYDEYVNLLNKYDLQLDKFLKDIENLEKKISFYKKYYVNNIDKISSIVRSSKNNSPDWLEQFEEYKTNLFKNKCISYRFIQKSKKLLQIQLKSLEERSELLNKCITNLDIKKSIQQSNEIIVEKKELLQKLTLSKCKSIIAKDLFDGARNKLEKNIKKAFGGITISQIYEKIEPHKRFKQLEYKVEFNKDDKAELYVKAKNDKDEVAPELFFSSAQLNAVALSIFLGGALSTKNPQLNTIFIDDPIGHFDDLNVLSFIDVLRTIITQTGWQIIISTHEENFYRLMRVKLDSKFYNSKFFVFKEEGNLVED